MTVRAVSPGTGRVRTGRVGAQGPGGGGVSPAFQTDFSSLPSWVSLSRASNGTMFDSTGKLTYGPNNFFTQSNNFSDAAWQKSGTASVTAGFTDPVGGSSATRLDLPAVNDFISQFVNPFPSPKGIHSVWVRSDSPGTIHLNDGSGGGWNVSVSVGTTWTLVDTGPQVQASSAVRIIRVSGDLASLYIYNQVLAAVTYETSARSADQVITTSLPYYGPRFDYAFNGSVWVPTGLLIEEARTNLFLQTGSPANQTITVANGTVYSVSFYGTGTLTLSGAATQTMNGSGANVRTSYTFTASTTSLVIAVSGSVTYPNVEAGGFATSHIPTTTATVPRSADVPRLVGGAFTALTTLPYSVVMKMVDTQVGFYNAILAMGGAGGTDQAGLLENNGATTSQIASQDNSTANHNLVATLGSGATTGPLQLALGASSGGRSLAANGGTVVTDANVPTVSGTDIFLAQNAGTSSFTTMHLAGIAIYSSRLSDATLQAKSVVGAAY